MSIYFFIGYLIIVVAGGLTYSIFFSKDAKKVRITMSLIISTFAFFAGLSGFLYQNHKKANNFKVEYRANGAKLGFVKINKSNFPQKGDLLNLKNGQKYKISAIEFDSKMEPKIIYLKKINKMELN